MFSAGQVLELCPTLWGALWPYIQVLSAPQSSVAIDRYTKITQAVVLPSSALYKLKLEP